MMAMTTPQAKPATKATPEQWIERLTIVLKTMDAMDAAERSAALRYIKSKYSNEWPTMDSY
jgi:hypothetical protein